MSRENDICEQAQEKARHDARRKYAFHSELQMVNEPLECVLLLGRLNEAIDTLSALQDEYYTNYIWNAGKREQEELEKEGLNEDLFYEMECKLSKLRTILMGENLNWNEVYQNLYMNAIGHEVYWKEFYKAQNEKLEYQIRKLEKQNKNGGNDGPNND